MKTPALYALVCLTAVGACQRKPTGEVVGTSEAKVQSTNESHAVTRSTVSSEQVKRAIEGKGVAAADIQIFDEGSDPNKLLGRPGQYTVKVNWKLAGSEATLEVFPDIKGAKARAEYVKKLGESMPLALQYVYLDETRNIVLRVPHEILPSDAKSWETWLQRL